MRHTRRKRDRITGSPEMGVDIGERRSAFEWTAILRRPPR
jgi:hypothetical protein